uniref:Uncharacterized protein n=1 Tax=Glossina morsitans morsitans TaxID=37546 RepID=A0A1B0G9X3_GLOMM
MTKNNDFYHSNIVMRHFFVDDLTSGGCLIDQEVKVRREVTSPLQKNGFIIRKWFSNDEAVLCDILLSDRASTVRSGNTPNISVNNVVLVKNESVPTLKW